MDGTSKAMLNNVLDAIALNELKDTICNNIVEEFIQIIDSYLEDTPQRLRSLSNAIIQGNTKTLQLEAHSLKSSSAIVGAKNLSLLCKQLEKLGRDGNINDAVLLVSQAMAEYVQVEAALQWECKVQHS
ncbi:Hpt domain-containing protein [Anabaena lutea]|uniref:Hpt domain-containing protein n=1 Tax=Anabaena lutea FACHB-196 TaxID=2692881 RepID=A0ABR8FE62_9NOST|nr:Hpt domain-containing protein [Anabaena lutea]MBD2568512.1 Hpt domain-containing protein [Anabaena lutea FACHB-196]